MEHVLLGSDHAGFGLKELIKQKLNSQGYQVIDVGCFSEESCDYPLFAIDLCKRIQKGDARNGILVCGTGIGMSMAANRMKGIRAALCANEYQARMSRAHNDSNVLCLGSRVIGQDLAFSILDVWLNTEFEGGRHKRRVDLIESI
ncbi:MAG: ribose 5-phosphate isomerase B [Deltaproteobacteria bacterium]|nr:ribose 5-phosphate isomerase B [Deltaproteobacteria bacterium]